MGDAKLEDIPPAYPGQPATYDNPEMNNQQGYNQNQGYNQQQPGYNQQQPGYNQQQPGYNQQQPGYNQQQPGYNQQQPGYNQQMQPMGHTTNNTVVIGHQPAAATVIVQQAAPRPPTYLGLSIFTLLCCNLLFGLIAIIFAVMSDSAYGDGDFEGARAKGKVAMGLSIAGILITIFAVVFVMIYLFVILPAQIFG